jgi:predicted esterase
VLRRLFTLVAVAALLLTAAGPAVSGGGGHRHRPDLTVKAGSVTLSGTTLTGSFTVKAKRSAKAKVTTAALHVRAGGRDVVAGSFPVKAVRPGKKRTVRLSVPLPTSLPAGPAQLVACADEGGQLRERSENNNCRAVGSVTLPTVSSVPNDPIPFQPDTVLKLSSGVTDYWLTVPTSYDASHQTPTTLFVWMHGCGGQGQYDIYDVSPGGAAQSWIALSLGGREDDCWDMDSDPAKVLAAVASVKTHFNIDPRAVVLGGYSSGGDLAYRTAFYNARSFAGVLAENTSPFRDTGSSAAQSIAAATWKFNVVHLAHLQDDTYPIAGVRQETDALKAAGFPVTRVERNGGHYDDPGTVADMQSVLLPYLKAGWRAPA